MKKEVDQALADINVAVVSVQALAAVVADEGRKLRAQEASAAGCLGHLEKARLNVLSIEEVEATRRKV